MAIRFPRYTAARRQAALAEAEKEFARPDKKRGRAKFVSIRTDQIKERLELFQPREFSYGAHTVDPDWVREYAAYRLRNHKNPLGANGSRGRRRRP